MQTSWYFRKIKLVIAAFLFLITHAVYLTQVLIESTLWKAIIGGLIDNKLNSFFTQFKLLFKAIYFLIFHHHKFFFSLNNIK